jgi:hypothetical protein
MIVPDYLAGGRLKVVGEQLVGKYCDGGVQSRVRFPDQQGWSERLIKSTIALFTDALLFQISHHSDNNE